MLSSNMPQIPHPQRQWHRGPRGPINALHLAARKGSTERVLSLLNLSSGSINIDEGAAPDGLTPLMIAALNGYSRIVSILLSKGANVSIADAEGWIALHHSAEGGHPVAAKLLVDAGAVVEAQTTGGYTPLHLAAAKDNSEVVRFLIEEAGANPNSRRLDGGTPMYMAAQNGQRVDAIKVLLRAGADPLLTAEYEHSPDRVVPLDAAARLGKTEVARELIQRLGIKGCGGASGGVQALSAAAGGGHVDIMRMLTDVGVTDTGCGCLLAATLNGCARSLKFLLRQNSASAAGGGYVNLRGPGGVTPLFFCVMGCRQGSPRAFRMLIDAGANTAGRVMYGDTPLNYVNSCLRDKTVKGGEDATQEELYRLEAMRRLLLQVEAVHAVSWLWPKAAVRNTPAAADGPSKSKIKAPPTPLTAMLPMLRRRAERPTVLVAGLARWVVT